MIIMMLAVLLATQESFFKAIAERDADSVRAMLAADPSLANAKNAKGTSAVINALFAIRKGEEAFPEPSTNATLQAVLAARPLLDHGADVLVRQAKGFTPMHEAALLGRADLIDLLLTHGAEINSMADNGHTPLAEAIRGHHDDLAAIMKSKGASLAPTPNDEDAPAAAKKKQ